MYWYVFRWVKRYGTQVELAQSPLGPLRSSRQFQNSPRNSRSFMCGPVGPPTGPKGCHSKPPAGQRYILIDLRWAVFLLSNPPSRPEGTEGAGRAGGTFSDTRRLRGSSPDRKLFVATRPTVVAHDTFATTFIIGVPVQYRY